MDRYEPATFEAKWRARWDEAELFRTREAAGRPKFYGLDFFPYPSGAGLSVGHCRNYIPTDVLCRMKIMQGFNVLHPMGFDAFGLPAENEAIKRQTHPAPMIDQYAATYKRQMDLIGISYDWSRSFKSSDPTYYKWTQWIFEILYKRGLAYRRDAAVNWCPVDKTVLADEEVVGGLCWRCSSPVEKKFIPQWFFRITAYAQRLIDDLEDVDWPEGIKQQQRNWIGRSEGVEFSMKVVWTRQPDQTDPTDSSNPSDQTDELVIKTPEREPYLRVFTTRIDTIFGVTFCVIAPEHPLVDTLIAKAEPAVADAIREYRETAKRMGDQERQVADREKTGVFTGSFAINPANGEGVPIWIADYVLMGYGTGAIMAVPGHDERDYEFATKFGIPLMPVIAPLDGSVADIPYVSKDGRMVNSGEYTGMTVADGQARLGEWMEGLGIGERKVNFKLRDWLISRQRYWGCPIPIIHTQDGEEHVVPVSDLPVYLPQVDNYEPSGDGTSPLAGIADFVNVTDGDGRLGRRETDTMGGFACSSWYFLRFCDPHNDDQAWSPERVQYWMPVDCYVGGAEHAVMHLLYARFWTKVLFDEGLVPVKEPFQRLMNQGQVLGQTPYRKPKEGEKLGVGEDGIQISKDEASTLPPDAVTWKFVRMSKSKGNVVTPDEAVAEYGADALRMYELFVAPFESDVEWSNDGMNGQVRFLSRVFRLITDLKPHFDSGWATTIGLVEMDPTAKAIRRATHKAILKSTEDIDRFAFNTYVSALMTYVNTLYDALKEVPKSPSSPDEGDVHREERARDTGGVIASESVKLALSEAAETLILLLAPGAPHTADELWEEIGKPGFTLNVPWPVGIPELAVDDVVTIAIQVNGKLRDTLTMQAGATNEELEAAAKASEKVQSYMEGQTVRKVIVVPGKLVNIVVG